MGGEVRSNFTGYLGEGYLAGRPAWGGRDPKLKWKNYPKKESEEPEVGECGKIT